MDDASAETKKQLRKPKKAVLLQATGLFDVDECGLDWLPSTENKIRYRSLLVMVAVRELRDILGSEYDPEGDFINNFLSLHKIMVNDLEQVGVCDPEFALSWWKAIEESLVLDICEKILALVPLFFDCARAFVSIHASSASVERLFGEAVHQEGTRRTSKSFSVTEMLLIVRSCVENRIHNSSG